MYSPTDLLYTQRCANATNILYTQHFLRKIRNSKISSFCYAHKRPNPFFLYIPTKKTLFSTIKYKLTIELISCQQTGKKSENWLLVTGYWCLTSLNIAEMISDKSENGKNPAFYYCDTTFSLVSTICA